MSIVSLGYSNDEILFILFFYTIGGILGYFAFRCQYSNNFLSTLYNCILTTCMGVFLAYIFTNLLEENKVFSKSMNILIGGLGSFGFPDLVITYFPSIKKILGKKILDKFKNKDKK